MKSLSVKVLIANRGEICSSVLFDGVQINRGKNCWRFRRTRPFRASCIAKR